jgi:hypothetical protein
MLILTGFPDLKASLMSLAFQLWRMAVELEALQDKSGKISKAIKDLEKILEVEVLFLPADPFWQVWESTPSITRVLTHPASPSPNFGLVFPAQWLTFFLSQNSKPWSLFYTRVLQQMNSQALSTS